MPSVAVLSVVLILSLLPAAVAQGGSARGDATEQPSRFSLVDVRGGGVPLTIVQGARLAPARVLGSKDFSIRFELPVDAEGPVEFYVNGEFAGLQNAPPYLLRGPEVLALARRAPGAGQIKVLAVPDVGYAFEVVFELDN